jgi:hypothetical protein
MALIPKVKTCGMGGIPGQGIGSSVFGDKLSQRGEYQSGKLPVGGFNPVFNFKNDKPNDYFSRKFSPTSGGGKKVY